MWIRPDKTRRGGCRMVAINTYGLWIFRIALNIIVIKRIAINQTAILLMKALRNNAGGFERTHSESINLWFMAEASSLGSNMVVTSMNGCLAPSIMVMSSNDFSPHLSAVFSNPNLTS